MIAPLLLSVLACKGPSADSGLDDTGLSESRADDSGVDDSGADDSGADDTGPTRGRRSGEVSLADAGLSIWGAEGDAVGTAAVGGRAWALAVAAPSRNGAVGVVGVFAALPEADAAFDDADAKLIGGSEGGYHGATLLAFGESGLAVGAFWDSRNGAQAGSVALYLDPLSSERPSAVWLGEVSDYAGIALASMGAPDGVERLAVGGHGADIESNDEGIVTLITADAEDQRLLFEADTARVGEHRTGWFGVSVAAGDLDGDGLQDLCVGAMGEPGQEASAGATHVFQGPVTGIGVASDSDATLQGESAWGYYGQALASGQDVDDDGLDDLLVAAPERAGGTIYLYTGALSGDVEAQSAQATFTAEGDGERAGFSVSFVQDQDGDGFGEVLIGATRHSPNEVFAAGAAYLVYGPHEGALSLADAHWTALGVSENARAGIDVQDAGDLDGDGFTEILIGARGEPFEGAPDAGVVTLWR